MRSAELFAGCGGLALGLSRAGFAPVLMAEWDEDAVATVLHNRARGIEHVSGWPIAQQDVRAIDWSTLAGTLDTTSGGPPCQPFGIGGKKGGHEDPRDMWPEAIRAIREGRPRGFLFENVRNLAGPKFSGYLEWILESFRRPDELRKLGEEGETHLARLLCSKRPPSYGVGWQVVNAADYGAAQIRFRVVIFGIRLDVGAAPSTMTPTHSRDQLLWDQWVTGDYWKRHGLKAPAAGPGRRDVARAQHLRGMLVPPPGLPWVTLRDAIAGLGQPDGRGNHVFRDGARVYAGHTGSELDMPSKALKAGDHGVPGGENMIRFPDGAVRYLTTREAARLVGLPDDFEFPRSWTESMRQMGNAVPAHLAEAAGRHLARMLDASKGMRGAVAA